MRMYKFMKELKDKKVCIILVSMKKRVIRETI
jgi:hypothetical protein